MTSNYVQDYAPSGVNVYGSGITASAPEPPSPLHWRTFALPKTDPDVQTYGPQGVIGWELKIDDLRGGYSQYGDFGRGGNIYDGDYRKTSISSLDQRWSRHLLLPPLVTQTTGALLGGTGSGGFYSEFGAAKTFVFGSGGASPALMKETSSSDPTPVAVAYNPGASSQSISCLAPIVIGGASSAERLAVGRNNVATEVLSDLTPTSAGTMHANTASMWGLLQSPINSATPGTGTLLIYAGSNPATISTLSITSAIGTAPTVALQNLPSGGAAIGTEQLQRNWPLRAYWLVPYASNGSSWGSSVQRNYVMSTNLEGTDPQVIPMGLPRIYYACLWDQKLVGTDGPRVIAYDGQNRTDLHLLRNRVNNSDFRWDCAGLWANDGILYALVVRSDITTTFGTAAGSTTARLEMYLPAFDSWAPVTGDITLDGGVRMDSSRTGVYGNGYLVSEPVGVGLPYSHQTGFMHLDMVNGRFDRFLVSPSEINPYYHYNQTGTNPNIAQQWATTGTYTSPYFDLPTLEGRWKRADQVVFGGQIAQGNVKVILNPNQGGSAVTFSGVDTTRSQPAPSSQARFQLLQIQIQLNQGSSTYKTPNGLPVVIRGRAYLGDPDVQSLGLPGGP